MGLWEGMAKDWERLESHPTGSRSDLHEEEREGWLGGDMSCADVQNKEGLRGFQIVLEPQSVTKSPGNGPALVSLYS